MRSPHAHARLRHIDKTAAIAAPGVLAVFTGENVLREGLGSLPCRFFPAELSGQEFFRPSHPILVADKVRHVGDRIALVVAETLEQAKDAGERLAVDYEILPAAASLEHALDATAPAVWDETQSNLSFVIERRGKEAVDRAFAQAAHVTRLRVHYPRASANPIEPRAALGMFDRFDRRYTLYSSTQAPYRLREIIASVVLRVPETDLRVVAPDIGGAFGMKNTVYPEDALVLWAAGRLGRPVKWTADRGESLLSDMHGRDILADGEIALAADGRVVAMRVSLTVNLGAYLTYSAGAPAINAATTLTSVYDLPLVHAVVRGVFTNRVPWAPIVVLDDQR